MTRGKSIRIAGIALLALVVLFLLLRFTSC